MKSCDKCDSGRLEIDKYYICPDCIEKDKMKLNLGCSKHYMEGYVNLDIGDSDTYGQRIKVDVIHDLNIYPYPFADDTFDFIQANAIIEHLDSPIRAMKEIKRILKDGGEVEVLVPHYSSWTNHSDPTHKWQYSIRMGEHVLFNQGMKLIKRRIIFSNNKLLRLFNFFPNIWPEFYDRFLANIIPSNAITWRFRK